MTVTTTTSSVSYTGDGTLDEYAVPFPFFADTDLVLTHTLANVTTTLVQGVDYELAGAGQATGTVTLTDNLADGAELVITRNTAFNQPTELRPQGTFSAKTHERMYDRATLQAQDIDRRMDDLEERTDDIETEQAAVTNWITGSQSYGGVESPVNYQLLAQKGVANGYASLDAQGTIPTAQLPVVPYDMSIFLPGVVNPDAPTGKLLAAIVIARACTVPFPGPHVAAAVTASTGNVDISVRRNGSTFGTCTFATGQTTGTWNTSTTTVFSPGDTLAVWADTDDATLADVSVTVCGTRG
jgi:hypothetical protein